MGNVYVALLVADRFKSLPISAGTFCNAVDECTSSRRAFAVLCKHVLSLTNG